MKRFLAAVIAMVMVITLLPVYGFAEGGELLEKVGSPVLRTQMVSYAITQQDGNPVLVGVPSGNPAHLMVLDLKTRKVLYEAEVDCGKTFYAYAKASNGDVYFAGYSAPIKLYKYSVTEKKVIEVCDTATSSLLGSYTATAVSDIAVDDKDNVYLATYPKSHILKYDGTKLTDLGSIYSNNILYSNYYNGDDYAKTLSYYNGCLYVGGNKEGTFLVEYNLETGARNKYEVELPADVKLSSMYAANVVGNRLFVFCYTVSSGHYMAVFDLDNKVWKNAIENASGSYAIASADEKYAYITKGVKLQKYDLATDTYQAAEFKGDIGGIRTKDNAVIDSKAYIAYIASGKSYLSIINLENGVINKYDDAIPKYPDMLESFMLDENGYIYASSYQGGLAAKYDVEKNEIVEEFSVGQASVIEEIDGKIYFATYPQADLCVYDPTLAVSSTNPKQLFAMPEENQGRPMDIVKAEDKLIITTIGGYGDADGKSSGCVVIYDTTTGKYTKYKGGDLEDYHMVGLYYDPIYYRVYVTTSVVGGHNSTPVYKDAKVFYFYLPEGAITENTTQKLEIEDSVTVKVSDFGLSSGNIPMCGGLIKDPSSDKLWSACYNGIFTVDMDSLKIADCISIDEGPKGISRWQPYRLEFDSAGNLYATPADKLVKVNTEDNTYTLLATDVFDMELLEGIAGTAIYTMSLKGDTIYVMNKQPIQRTPEKVDGWYLVKTFEDFMYIQKEPTAKYKLMNNITVGTKEEPFARPFAFSGEFDGQGYTIDANILASGSVGLFSNQPTAGGKITIKNLTLTGSIARDNSAATDAANGTDCSVGSFIGYTANHTTLNIENCVNKATVNGGAAGSYVGGLAGRVWGNAFSVISKSKNLGRVSSTYAYAWTGGIAGQYSGTISECANGGLVTKAETGGNYAAGLVADFRKGGMIEKSANFATLKAVHAGGLVGRVYELDTSNGVKNFTLQDSFNAGNVSASTASGCAAGGLLGARTNPNASSITTFVLNNCYNVGVISGFRPRIFISIGGDAATTVSNVWYNINYSGSGFNAEGNKGMHQFSASQKTLADVGLDSSIWTWNTADFAYPYITSVGVISNGSASGPYEIRTTEDFMAIKDNPSAAYKLMNDITVGTEAAPFTQPFEFSGILDGNGYTIDAYIKATGIPTGLFSKQTDASKGIEIKNLTLTGRIERTDTTAASGSAEASVGGFLGYNVNYGKLYFENCVNNAEIVGNAATNNGGFVGYTFGFTETAANDCTVFKNCTNNGSVTVNAQGVANMGGLAGSGSGTIINCVNTGSLSGKGQYIGGLVGRLDKSGDIQKSYNLGTISTEYSFGAGGLVGIIWQNVAPVIKNSFNAGNVTNTYVSSISGAGGLIGRGFNTNEPATIEDCYNSGVITCGTAANGNQIAGYNAAGFTATDVYYVSGANATVTSAKAFGDLKTIAAIGFDENVWSWDGEFYAWPVLKGSNAENGTDAFPYIIENKEDFLAIANEPTASYYLANDIELGNYAPFEFKGHLFGKKNAETGEYPAINVAIDAPTTIGAGLFSMIDGFVRIEGIKVTGSIKAGGIAGGIAGLVGVRDSGTDTLVSGSYIKNCINEANIEVRDFKGSSDFHVGRTAGGFIGYYRNGGGRLLTLTNLENRGNITADKSYVGGIAGNSKGSISNSVNKGILIGSNCVGGIVGYDYDNRPVTNCYNTGDIFGDESLGGIVGRWHHPGGGTVVENCYNTGDISATDISNYNNHGSVIGNVIGSGAANCKNVYNAGKVNGSYCDLPFGTQATASSCTNVYLLTVDGDTDSNSRTLGIEGLEKANLGTAFTTGTGNYTFPQLVANVNNEALEIVMLENVDLTVADSTAEISLDMATNLKDKEAMLVLAVYDATGALVSAKPDAKAIGKAKTDFACALSVADGQTVKAVLWNEDMVPYCGEIVPAE